MPIASGGPFAGGTLWQGGGKPLPLYPTSGNTPSVDLAAGSGDVGGHVNTHAFRYYRVWTADAAGVSGFGTPEIEIAIKPGDLDTTLGQTYTSSTNFAGQGPANAFDDNSATEFTTDFVGAQPYWIKVDYGATAGNWVAANELRIRAPASTNHGIRDFIWQGSDDNSTWTDLYTATTGSNPAWNTNETRQYVATAGGTSSGINGSLSATLGILTSSATGKLLIQGSLNKTLGALTITAIGHVLLKGTLNKTLGVLTLSSTGTLKLSGSLNKTLGVLTGSSTAKLLLKGSLAKTLGILTSASTGRLLIKGSVNTTLGSLVGTETGQLLIKGSLNKLLGPLVLAGTGQSSSSITGTLSVPLGGLTASASGYSFIHVTIKTKGGFRSSIQDQLRPKRYINVSSNRIRI